ncbi:alpha-L-fucosidase [Nitrospirillum sp. BR 11164]|uniref:alpha-L-fucosidase n=1 Tax=Nitrospirillum sp. BR 11164 TaxID=3104324 RepID=UPI002AFE0AFC|nr:alpha-L-fucosidase [Nitrospirillum sp. BR 11164]MEA1648641.1 alpha-L-fucosidase [Nitrospirillum sp. BR 11164]
MAVIRRRLATILAGTALATLMALGAGARADTAPPAAAQAYTPTAENLAARQWFQDARFGVFLHWGLYSELGGAGKMGIAEWIMDENQNPRPPLRTPGPVLQPHGLRRGHLGADLQGGGRPLRRHHVEAP